MSKSFIKVDNSWRELLAPYVKDGTTWRPIRYIWIKEAGVWRRVFGTDPGSIVFPVGTSSWTVPAGVYTISATGCGGGGQGGKGDTGKNNDGPGAGGGGSNLITRSYSVIPGTVLSITVGLGGSGPNFNGAPGGNTTIIGGNVDFFAQGGGGGQGRQSTGNILTGLGYNGAEYDPRILNRQAGGLSTNGGANGGNGGSYSSSSGSLNYGQAGQNGKLTLFF